MKGVSLGSTRLTGGPDPDLDERQRETLRFIRQQLPFWAPLGGDTLPLNPTLSTSTRGSGVGPLKS